jgi:hypothetical protein
MQGIHVIVSPHTPGTGFAGLLSPKQSTSHLQPTSPFRSHPSGMSNLVLSASTQTQLMPSGAIAAPGTRPYAPIDVSLPSPLAMYPVIYQSSFPTGISYVVDQVATVDTSRAAGIGTYPLIGPVYTQFRPKLPSANGQNQGRLSCGRSDSRRHNATRISRSPFYNLPGHHNHVDVTRIREGIDVRTTVSRTSK